jgi:AAA+ ATPase superfamily predicted ATPase
MQFYLREKELKQLVNVVDDKHQESKFIIVSGSRKVGKTTLVNTLVKQKNGIYITISAKSSSMQLNDISDYLREINPPGSFIPKFENWKHLFEYFFMLANEKPVIVVLDEFHNLYNIDPDVFIDFRAVWDTHASKSKLCLISVTYDLNFIKMNFHNEDSPLYRIMNFSLRLTPFTLIDVISLFKLNKSNIPINEIIDLYIVFGGYPKYYHLFDLFNLWDKNLQEILRILVFQAYAPLANELNDIIINLFTRENKVYISVLQSIALNNHTITHIADSINIKATTLSKYLLELEKKKHIIKRKQPINVSYVENSKFGMYYISSYFENFWFRFIQPDIISFENGQYDRMLQNISQNFDEYRKQRIPLVIRELMQYSKEIENLNAIFPYDVTSVGSLWNRKKMVDIVAINDEKKKIILGSVYTGNGTMKAESMNELYSNISEFEKQFVGYEIKKVIFHNSTVSLDLQNLMKDKGLSFSSYAKLLKDIYD